MALAIMLSTRVWLGGVVSAHWDLNLIQALADKIKGLARCRPLLLAVDGLVSYVTAFRSVVPLWHGEEDPPKLVSWPNIAIVQVVKQRKEGQLNITRRIIQGSRAMVQSLIRQTQGQGIINMRIPLKSSTDSGFHRPLKEQSGTGEMIINQWTAGVQPSALFVATLRAN